MKKIDREIAEVKLIFVCFPTNDALRRYIKYKEIKKKDARASYEYIFREYILRYEGLDTINDSSTYRKSVEKINKKGYGSVITRKEFVRFVLLLHSMDEKSNKFSKTSFENYILKRNFEIKLSDTDVIGMRNPSRANVSEPKSLSKELWKIYTEWTREWIENGLIENVMEGTEIKKGLIWNIEIVKDKDNPQQTSNKVRIKCYLVTMKEEYVYVFQNKDVENSIKLLKQGKCDIKVIRFIEKMVEICMDRMQSLAISENFDELYRNRSNYILNSWFSGWIVNKNYKANSHIKMKLSEGNYDELKKIIKNQEKK